MNPGSGFASIAGSQTSTAKKAVLGNSINGANLAPVTNNTVRRPANQRRRR
jgi:hypothetical protein